MTMQFWRIYKGRGRAPSDFVSKVWAASAEAAIAQVQAQPAYKDKHYAFEAVASHQRKAGK